MASNQSRRSLSRKAAAAVMCGLLVFGSTPILPIAQALAGEVEVNAEGQGQVTEVESVENYEGAPSSTIDDLAIGVQTESSDVAQIGENTYASLKAAIEAAPSGSTITLLADDTTSFANEGIVIAKNLTIDGNYKTIKGVSNPGIQNVTTNPTAPDVAWDGENGSNSHGFFIKSGDVTIKNVSMTEFGDTNYVNKFGLVPILTASNYSGKLTLENVSIDKFNRQAICIWGGDFSITGGTITANAENRDVESQDKARFQQPIEIRGGTGTITGTAINGESTAKNAGIPGAIVSWSPNVTITDVIITNFDGNGIWADSGPNNTGVTVGGNTSVTTTKNALFSEEGSTLYVTGGAFTGTLAVDNNQSSSISITSGMYDNNPNGFVADGYGTIRYTDTMYRVASTNNLIKDVEFDVPAEGLTYNGTEQKPAVTKFVNVNDETLVPESTVYPEEYGNNVNAGTATAKVEIYSNGYYSVKEAQGSGPVQNQAASKPLYESAMIAKTFSIAKLDLAKATVTIDPAEYTYDGKAKEPTVTVTYDGKVIPTADYKVTYESNVEVGTAKVKVSAVGNNTTGSVTKDFTIKPSETIQVKGKAHMQKDGDKKAKEETEGAVFGTTGESKRMESISIELGTNPDDLGIEYRSHVQGIGWEKKSAKNGEVSGTTGESKRLEAIQIALTGAKAKDYDVFYRVHSQTFGWLGWAANGEPAGTAGQSKRLEAIEVCVLPKGQTPKDYDATKPAYVGRVTGVAHVQGTGTTKATNSIIGTTGQGKRLESLRITLPNQPFGGGIEYQSHVQGKGWETEWASNGGMSGTQGKSKRIEAVRIQLTGGLKDHFSVWYRVHSQTYGWSGWATNGEPAGTSGLSRRAEAIDVIILPKGASAPGSTDNAIRAK